MCLLFCAHDGKSLNSLHSKDLISISIPKKKNPHGPGLEKDVSYSRPRERRWPQDVRVTGRKM